MPPGWANWVDEHIDENDFLRANKVGAIVGGVAAVAAGVVGGAAAVSAAAIAAAPVYAATAAELATLETVVTGQLLAVGGAAWGGRGATVVYRATELAKQAGRMGAKAGAEPVLKQAAGAVGALLGAGVVAGAYAGAAVEAGGKRVWQAARRPDAPAQGLDDAETTTSR